MGLKVVGKRSGLAGWWWVGVLRKTLKFSSRKLLNNKILLKIGERLERIFALYLSRNFQCVRSLLFTTLEFNPTSFVQ